MGGVMVSELRYQYTSTSAEQAPSAVESYH